MAGLTPEPDGSYLVMGQRVELPVLVRKAKQAAIIYLVRHEAAQRIVAPTGLRVKRERGGMAVVTIALVDYIDNDLGRYTELGLVFMVEDPEHPNATTTYIHRLPVNGEFTYRAGYGIWGFPKWVTDLRIDFAPEGLRAELIEDGNLVVRITAKRGIIPVKARTMPMLAYTCDEDGVVRRTAWTTEGQGRQLVRPGGVTVELGYGHPLADELRALGFPRRNLAVIYDPHMKASFGAPEIITPR